MSRPATCLVALLAACSGSAPPPPHHQPPPPADAGEYRATIRWTERGVPHVVADDLAGVAFGQGYAFAAEHGCLLAEQVVKLRSQRSRNFGPGPGDANVASDFGYLSLGLIERARAALPTLSAESRAVVAGFAAGYDLRLREHGLTGFCRGAAWVTPITEVDVLARALDAFQLASSAAFVPAIGGAHPHRAGDAAATGALPQVGDALASNGWAIGAERSASGHGMLVANPHFPWAGPLTFYEAHLTVPGQLDAYGATLVGLPLVSIAFTRDVAWTHTFSDAARFTVYRLRLDPADPTRYAYGDQTRAMTRQSLAIEVLQPDGSLARVERTLWRSHYGPMLDGGPLAWDADGGTAFTLRDAAEVGTHGLDQYLAMMRAHDVAELRAALLRYQSTPYVNVMATDRGGNVFYADGSRVPNLSPAALGAWGLARRTIPAVQQAWDSGIVALDGSMPLFEWVDDPSAGAPGVIPFSAAPQLTRRDFVFNSNDSCWIANPAQPLTAQSPLYGDVEHPLTPRSRMNLRLLTGTGPDSASGADGKFDLDELEHAITTNRVFTAELLGDEVIARCRATAQPGPPGRGAHPRPPSPAELELLEACEILARWDRHADLDSKGAALWRELVATFDRRDYYGGSMFATPFDPARPIDTPAGLAPAAPGGPDPLRGRLQLALDRLHQAGVAADARLGDVQFTEIGGRRYPVHGSPELEGNTNQTQYQRQNTMAPSVDPGQPVGSRSGLTDRGYPVNYGTSFLMVVELGDDGPRARGLMTYGASVDPASPLAGEQMELWAGKKLQPFRFSDADIEAAPGLRVETVHAPRTP